MSKKSKKNQKNVQEDLPSKSQCRMLSETLDKNSMDHTQYFSFVSEDFDNLTSRSIEDVNEPVLEKIASDYKKLLISPTPVFWSTCSYNSYLQKSLDSFLKYAKKLRFAKYSIRQELVMPQKSFSEEQFIKRNHSYLEWIQEISRLVFLIYCRMSKNTQQEQELSTGKIVFENWLFDTVKGLDLCALYSFEDLNKKALKTVIDSFYGLNKEYFEDFQTTLKFLTKLLTKNVNFIVDVKKREKLLGGDTKITKEDIELRYMNIVSILDLSYIFNDIMAFYPFRCQELVLVSENTLQMMENLYYEIDGFRNFAKPEDFKEAVLPLISQILTNVASFFYRVFGFIIEGITDKFITEINAKKYLQTLETFLFNFGKMIYGGKKDPINLSLMRHLIRFGFDLRSFLEKMPVFLPLGKGSNQEKSDILQVTFESLKEELKKQEENFDEKESNEVEEVDNVLIEAKNDENKQKNEEESNPKENLEEIIEEVKKEVAPSVHPQEKIRFTEVIVGKKDRKTDLSLSVKEQNEAAAFIKNQIEYEDEYDDTLEIYNEGRVFVEKNQLDPDSEEEYQINENPEEYEDERNDDFVRSYVGYPEKKMKLDSSYKIKEFYPKDYQKPEEANGNDQKPGVEYQKKYPEGNRSNYNKGRDFYREKDEKGNEEGFKKEYSQRDGGYYKGNEDNRAGYKKDYYNNKGGGYKKEYKTRDDDYNKGGTEGGYKKEFKPRDEDYNKEQGGYKKEFKPRDDDYNKGANEQGGYKKEYKPRDNGNYQKEYKPGDDYYNKGANEQGNLKEKEGEGSYEDRGKPSTGGSNYQQRKKYYNDKSYKDKASYKRKY